MVNPAKKAYKGRLLLNLIPIFRQSGADVAIVTTGNKPPFVSVAIKARAEQVYLLCRAAATKRSAANLKGGLEGM